MRVDCADVETATRAEDATLGTADRLEAVLSAYRADSPYNQCRRSDLVDPPPEVVEVLALAARWHARTGGAFNPCLGALMRRWDRAAVEQQIPSAVEMIELAASTSSLPTTPLY